MAVWDGVIPADLPGPNDDPDVLMGLKAAGGAEGAGASALDSPSLPAGASARPWPACPGIGQNNYDVILLHSRKAAGATVVLGWILRVD